MDVGKDEFKWAKMLGQLKVTVEILLGCHPASEWDVYGGTYRLHAVLVDILKDGFRFFRDTVIYFL